MGHDAHTKLFDDKVVAENIQAAVDIGETQGQLQEQADVLPSSALHDKAVPHQELQEETQMDRKKRDHKDSQTGRYRPDAGPLLDPLLGVVPTADQNVNAPEGAETYDTHGKKKAKYLEGDEDLGAPGAVGHVVEARVLFYFPVEVVNGDTPGPHQDPDGAADPEDLPGGPAVADQERVLDGQEPVQANEADREDAAVHADKVDTLRQGTEGWEGSPHVVQDHLEREGEHQQQVEDCQVDHVDGGGGILRPPPLQEGVEASDGQQVEKQAQEEGGDVGRQPHDFHQLIHVMEGAVLAFVELTHVLSYINDRVGRVHLTLQNWAASKIQVTYSWGQQPPPHLTCCLGPLKAPVLASSGIHANQLVAPLRDEEAEARRRMETLLCSVFAAPRAAVEVHTAVFSPCRPEGILDFQRTAGQAHKVAARGCVPVVDRGTQTDGEEPEGEGWERQRPRASPPHPVGNFKYRGRPVR
ncbi:hypothetical protein PAL_GLEAN10014317 [Pteropus alecto]|uniref:Uncharacterized protein n=1 Tax=Pteropus alecto TaxID=9402 RepID=L5L054_PTEAL|nr:hypothetical protein PAL_GLEAN10014317 [Pteropus alecto]